ncbi:hypothetical protein Tco_1203133, partial [Tanacetum coccineum]
VCQIKGNGYLRKGQKQNQKQQNRARERKEREEKSKSKSNQKVKVNKILPRKVKVKAEADIEEILDGPTLKHSQSEEVQELLSKLVQDLQSINEELAEYINTPSWNLPTSSYDDDDDEYSFATQEYFMTCSTAITPDLPITDSLIMEDKHLDTIPEMESDEFIKYSVENLVQNPSKSEDASDGVCDLPLFEDFPKSHLVTFSNPLFDINDDCTSSDDESSSEEDVPMENFNFFSNPLFDLDEEIVSTEVNLIQNEVLDSIDSIPPGIDHFDAESDLLESLLNRDILIDSSPKIDSFLDEFAGELTLLKSIPPGIDDDNLDPEGEIHLVERLVYDNSSPPEDLNVENSIEYFSPSPIPVEDSDYIMEEIDLFLTPDDSMPPGIENDDYDSEGDIHFLEELLSNDSPPLPENELSNLDHLNDLSSPRPPPEPPDDGIYFEPDTGILTIKVVGDIFEHHVLMPRLLPTQPTLASNEEKSPHFLSHRSIKAFQLFSESPMMIHGGDIPLLDVPFLHFYPP